MKKLLLVILVVASINNAFTQNLNPYQPFGYQSKNQYVRTKEDDGLLLDNKDTSSVTKRLLINFKSKQIFVIDKNDSIISVATLPDYVLTRFISVDPLTKKYADLTPYQFASNTPIQAVDLDGLEAFYANDGLLLTRLGTSSEVRLVNAEFVREHNGQKVANKDLFANSTSIGLTNEELNTRAFLTLIRHAEKHSVIAPEDYDQRNAPDKNGIYPTSKGKKTPFGAYQLTAGTFRSLLDDKSALTNPENQDKAALNDLQTFKKGSAYTLIVNDDLSSSLTQNTTIQKISDILGTRTNLKGVNNAQWPSLPGQSQQGLNLDQSGQVFRNAVSNELQNKSAIATPQGSLITTKKQ